MAVAELKQGMSLLGLKAQWVPHAMMPVDGFTKPYTRSNLSPLLHILRHGTFQLADEFQQLVERQRLKEHSKPIARSKSKKMDPD
eukprot:1586843-Amphidinium_carterae.1